MLKERARLLAALTFGVDLAMVAAAFFAAFWVRAAVLPTVLGSAFAAFYPLSTYLPLLPLVLLIWATVLGVSGTYRSHRTVPLLDEAWSIVRSSATSTGVLALTIYALRLDRAVLGEDEISRVWVALVGALSCLFLLADKVALRLIARYVRTSGYNYRTVLLVGTNQAAVTLADSIANHRYWGFKVIGFVTHPASADSAELPRHPPVLGTTEDIPRLVTENPVDDVVFCIGRRDLDAMEDLFLCLHEQGIRTRFALNLFPHTKAAARLEELDGVPLLSFSTTPERVVPLFVKRVLDVAISALLLTLAMPAAVAIAAAIKLTTGGKVLYRQTRCGLNGRLFTLYKFCTMVEDAEERQRELLHLNEMDGPVFKLTNDPRVTWIGRFLRKLSLDELPQLANVLRGDMSLVGPRPPIPAEVARYQRWQRRRLSMKPGLTCLWQISGRNQIQDFDRWIELDLQYIDNWSPWLDLKILFKTVPVVLSGRGAS